MTGEAFVRQRGKKLQIGNLPSMIDVNIIWRSGVLWRCQVKRRAENLCTDRISKSTEAVEGKSC